MRSQAGAWERVYEFTRFVRQDDPHLVYPQPLVPWLRPWNALHPRLRLPSGRPLRVRKRSPPRVPMTVLCLPNTRQCERQSLQGSAFPGKSLGTRWTSGGAWGRGGVFPSFFVHLLVIVRVIVLEGPFDYEHEHHPPRRIEHEHVSSQNIATSKRALWLTSQQRSLNETRGGVLDTTPRFVLFNGTCDLLPKRGSINPR